MEKLTFEEKCNYWFVNLTEKEKNKLIETCMPMCGTYRVIDQNIFTIGMYKNFLKEHTKGIKWELHEYLDTVDGYYKVYNALGYDKKGREYKCIAELHLGSEIIATEIEPTLN